MFFPLSFAPKNNCCEKGNPKKWLTKTLRLLIVSKMVIFLHRVTVRKYSHSMRTGLKLRNCHSECVNHQQDKTVSPKRVCHVYLTLSRCFGDLYRWNCAYRGSQIKADGHTLLFPLSAHWRRRREPFLDSLKLWSTQINLFVQNTEKFTKTMTTTPTEATHFHHPSTAQLAFDLTDYNEFLSEISGVDCVQMHPLLHLH